MVCARCAADPATCSEPYARVIDIGDATVRDIGPTGGYAVVSRADESVRVLDVDRCAWNRSYEPDTALSPWPRLTRDDRVIEAAFAISFDRRSSPDHTGFVRTRLADGARDTVRLPPGAPFVYGCGQIAVSDDGEAFVSIGERVAIVQHTTSPITYTTKQSIDTVCIDGARRLLVTGAGREVVVDALGRRLVRRARLDVGGEVSWIGIGGTWLAIAVHVTGWQRIEMRCLDAPQTITSSILTPGRVRAGAFSRDARYLAVGVARALHVYDLERETEAILGGHDSEIEVIRFSDDHRLLSGSHGRLIVRPRDDEGYAAPLGSATCASD